MEKKNEVFSLLYPEGYTNEDKEQHQMKNYEQRFYSGIIAVVYPHSGNV